MKVWRACWRLHPAALLLASRVFETTAVSSLLAPLPTFAISVRRGLGALVTGSLAVGAVVAGRRKLQSRQPETPTLPPALGAEVAEMPVLEGTTRYYVRPGEGRHCSE